MYRLVIKTMHLLARKTNDTQAEKDGKTGSTLVLCLEFIKQSI